MKRISMKNDVFMHLCDLRINNSVNDPLIVSKVGVMGYGVEKLQEGVALLGDAQEASNKFDREYGELKAAFDERDASKMVAEATAKKLKELGKVVFKGNNKALSVLQINSKDERTYSGWLKQRRSFYANLLANTEWVEAYSTYGITQEDIEAGQASILDVEAKGELIMREKGDAQQATKERDAIYDALEDWVTDYEIVAKIALADQPQLLEKLGIVVKS